MELGQQAAKEAEQQLPRLRDAGVESFVAGIDPGNREAYISLLRVQGRAGDSRKFAQVQDRLQRMPAAPTAEERSRVRAADEPARDEGKR